jgi:serine/threonine-protein kinase
MTKFATRTGRILQGRYKVGAPIAEGGMGVVYRAERVGIERPVVVKFLHAVLTDQPGVVDRFEREARATARLNHPNCVSLVDFGLDDGAPYLVMEYVEGRTLADILDKGPVSPPRALHIARQILAGLAHAHTRGILHRDLKPANVMIIDAVETDDFVKILDFGLAKLLGPSEVGGDVTVQGIAIGTPGYMSPEQASGIPSDKRADIYCIGALLYHLVSGQKPFDGDDVHSVLRRHREETPLGPRGLVAEISVELERLILRAMERDPARRYQSAEDMIDALKATPEWARHLRGDDAASRPARIGAVGGSATQDSQTRAEQPASRAKARRRAGGGAWLGGGLLLGAAATAGAGWATGALDLGAIGIGAPRTPPPVAAQVCPPAAMTPAGTAPAPAPTASTPSVAPAAIADAGVAPAAIPEAGAAAPTGAGAQAAARADEADDDGAGEDDRQPPPEIADAAQRPAPNVRSLGDVRALLKRNDVDGALAGLYKLRRAKPPAKVSAEIATLLGHIYYDRRWYTDALREYRYACQIDPKRRGDTTLINNTIRTLADKKTNARARRLIGEVLGRAALPSLRQAAEGKGAFRGAPSELKKRAAAAIPLVDNRPIAKRR